MACKRIIWAGRLVHAKGRLGMKLATEVFPIFKDCQFEIYAGPLPDEQIIQANENVKFLGVVDDLLKRMEGADLVLGGGRVALEAMSLGIPVMAVGQKCYVGILTNKNIQFAKKTNFGDMHKTEFIDYQTLTDDLAAFISGETVPDTARYKEYLQEYKLASVTSEVREVYQQAINLVQAR